MKVVELFKNFLSNKESSKMLGRWRLESCSKKLGRKIDLSNEDHCGPCGEYILSKANEKVKTDAFRQPL
jgi:hypothetical protein